MQGIADAMSSPERLDEVLLDRLLSRCSDHLSLFAAPGTLDRAYDISSRRPATRCSTSCARTCLGSSSTCRISGRPGPSGCCSGPTAWCSPPSPTSPISATPRTSSICSSASRPNDRPPLLVLNRSASPSVPRSRSRISATRSSSSRRRSSISIRSSSAPPPTTARWSRRWPASRRLPSSSARSPACLPHRTEPKDRAEVLALAPFSARSREARHKRCGVGPMFGKRRTIRRSAAPPRPASGAAPAPPTPAAERRGAAERAAPRSPGQAGARRGRAAPARRSTTTSRPPSSTR